METYLDIILVLSYYGLSYLIVHIFCKRNKFIFFSFISYLFFISGALLFKFLCGSYPPDCHYVFLLMAMLMIGEPTHHIFLIIALVIVIIKFVKKHRKNHS